jgi:hypothetical protein
VFKNMSEKRAGVRNELVFTENDAKFCSHIFGHVDPKQDCSTHLWCDSRGFLVLIHLII